MGENGAALVEYLPLIAVLVIFLLIGLPVIGEHSACNLCAAKYGFELSSNRTSWEVTTTAYASVGPPPPPPDPDQFLQLCKDGFVDITTCQ